jgi:hypothetical protein
VGGREAAISWRCTHPPTTAVLAICVYLPREVFFCFFGFAGAVGFFAAPSGFGLLGDTCSSFGFGDSCRCRSTWPQERRQRLERSSRSAFCGARSEPNGVNDGTHGVHLLSSDAEPGARPEKPVPRLSKRMRREKEAKRP